VFVVLIYGSLHKGGILTNIFKTTARLPRTS